jgi:hypothetical protein
MFSEENNRKKEKFIKFSVFKNGFLEQLMHKHYDRHLNYKPTIEWKEMLGLLFMFLFLLRTVKSLTLNNGDKAALMYICRPWQHLGMNYIHMEVLLLLWALKFIGLHLLVIQSPHKLYKWLDIYAFLNGVLPHQRIGNFFILLFFGELKFDLLFSRFLLKLENK